ncbi:MAG TPA: signal peptidase I [Candidatus Paceibacterota bacterium]
MKITPVKIGYYLFIGFLGVIALTILASIFPITGNYKILVVQSGSMEPGIPVGSTVVVKPAAEYNVGDVITFGPVTKTKPPTTHRIVGIKGEQGNVSYVTKGDANEDSDPRAVAKKDVLGKVLFSAPYFGYIIDFARKPLGFILIIGLPAAVIIGDEIRKIFAETKRMLRKRNENN